MEDYEEEEILDCGHYPIDVEIVVGTFGHVMCRECLDKIEGNDGCR